MVPQILSVTPVNFRPIAICLVNYTKVCKFLEISYVPKIVVELNDIRLSARASPQHRGLWIILLILIRVVIVLSVLSMLNVLSVPPNSPTMQTSPPYDTPSEIDEVVLVLAYLT